MPAADATKLLARDYVFQLNTGTIALPVWATIGGVNTFSFDSSKTDADTTDFDSNGDAEHLPASRSRSMSIEGFRLEDVTDGTRNAGQEAVESWAELKGPSGIKQFRFYHKTSLKGKMFMASANVTGPSGGNDDAASWAVDITISGAVTNVTVVP